MAVKSKGGGWLKWVFILAIIGGGVGVYFYFNNDQADAPAYLSSVVQRGEVTQLVTASGTLNPVTNITVGSQISGIIKNLYADWNSPVKAGQVIAELDPATFKASVAQAEGDLANVKASLEIAQIEANRAEELFKAKLISGSDHDTSLANLHQAQAIVQIKQASLDNTKVNLSRCTIYAPVDGTVISRNIDVGQTVAASLSAPTLFIIANDLSQMQIDANVSEAEIGKLEEGQNVNFEVDAFPDRAFTGKIRQIRNFPTTVQNVVTYDAVISVSNPDLKLRPGMTATASIITAQRTDVLKIPNSTFRVRPLEPSTNTTFAGRMLAKIGLGAKKIPPVTNAVPIAKAADTNNLPATAEAPLTGNEPPQELMRRVREMRDRGEEVPPAISAKLRELFQSGAIQRPAGGGRGQGGGGNGGTRPRSSQPAARNIYLLTTNSVAGGDATPAPKQVRVRTGISDGSFTEITEGLNEGDVVITGLKLAPAQNTAAPSGSSPFGGGGGGGPGGGGFRGGGGGGGGGGR